MARNCAETFLKKKEMCKRKLIINTPLPIFSSNNPIKKKVETLTTFLKENNKSFGPPLPQFQSSGHVSFSGNPTKKKKKNKLIKFIRKNNENSSSSPLSYLDFKSPVIIFHSAILQKRKKIQLNLLKKNNNENTFSDPPLP